MEENRGTISLKAGIVPVISFNNNENKAPKPGKVFTGDNAADFAPKPNATNTRWDSVPGSVASKFKRGGFSRKK